MLRRFEREAVLEGGQGWHYAIMQRDNGEFIDHNPGSPELAPDQMMFARDLLSLLNRDLHHDGAWVIVFTHPVPGNSVLLIHAEYHRMCIIFVDADGDPQFTADWVHGESEELDFADVMLSGRESWGQRCESAWQLWKKLMVEVIDPAEGQTFKRAQGQQPTAH
ncbi:hypothetical protein NKI25_18645 [Mesorhizobium sp. M0808]|uniref:hypothetical protein n=1 Tax=Mesorhizobium sp. M0808 TaxID=2957002 RepID=UPI00333BF910